MALFDRRGSAVAEGELQFAGWREAVDLDDPSSILEEQERVSLARRRECAQAALELARELKDAYAIALFSGVLKTTEEAWLEAGAGVSYMTLAEAVGDDEDVQAQQLRLSHYRTFCRYIAQGADKKDLASLVRNFLAMVRRIMPELLDGISQVEMGRIMGEDKQATQAREARVVEDFQKRRGVAAYRGLGKTAGDESRARMAAAAAGNKNRATAAKRKSEGEVKPVASSPKGKGKAKKTARKMATAAAKRFLERAGQFVLISAATQERREVSGLLEAKNAWLTGGMRMAGGEKKSDANRGVIYEGGRMVARIDYDGNIRWPKGAVILAA
jgi:hypothetical protein